MRNFILKSSHRILKFSLWILCLVLGMSQPRWGFSGSMARTEWKKKLGILLLGGVLLSGCSHRLGDFTMGSSYNVQNLNYDSSDQSATEGESCMVLFVFIPLGDMDNRIKRAMDNAIANGREAGNDGDLLVNVRIERNWFTLLIFASDCIVVKGDLVKISSSHQNPPVPSHETNFQKLMEVVPEN